MKISFLAMLFGLTFCSFSVWANSPLGTGFHDNASVNMVDTRCNMSLGAQTIDYGSKTRWELKSSSNTPSSLTPGKRTLMLSVICPYSQPIQFFLSGAGTAEGQLRYGDKGSLRLTIRDAKVDNNSVQLAISAQNGIITGQPQPLLMLKSDSGFSPTENGQAIKGKVFNAMLDIEPEIKEYDTKVTSPQINETSFTVTLVNL
ncbi:MULTISPECIES: hypothetical protein [unclassified Serratia (in: enterobacteria)]|uniref:hypothetical protein n=1 Tax=unclassified Serratia (in: enterobacteria) TaxID=2647522 RepID=UPI000508741F|nr:MULTISPECIES: hypothetical protein [unclassified Serratia (in: enterobacteria)]KFK95640.1 hypothetical protein JV45_07745 [Serratia sp. Ag2]KFL00346.1 hypothetical protein IV04_02575 [Serratia sp. Ag1]